NTVTAHGTATAPCTGTVDSPNDADDTDTCQCKRKAIEVSQICTDGCVGATGVVFSGTVTNTGTVTLTGVNVTGTSCSGSVSPSTLAPGATGTWSCTVTCTGTGGPVTNTVTAHGTATAPCTGTVNSPNDADDTDTCQCKRAAIEVSQICSDGCVNRGGVVFSGTVTNTGTVTLTGVSVTGTSCSASVSPSTLAPGATGTWSCTVTCTGT